MSASELAEGDTMQVGGTDPPELSVNTERRRPGELSLGMIAEHSFFAWVTVAEARDFAMRILGAAREAEDMEIARA